MVIPIRRTVNTKAKDPEKPPPKPQPTCPPCNMVVESIVNGIVSARCSRCGLGMQTR